MAIAANSLTSGSSSVDGSSFATASVSPAVNTLILIAASWNEPAKTGGTPTVSGGGLTYAAVRAPIPVTTGSANFLGLFRAMGSPTTAAITLDFGALTITSINWSVVEFTEALTGSNGANAITQNAFTTSPTSGTTWDAGTLAAFANPANRPYACYAAASSTPANVAPEAGWTELHEVEITLNDMKLETCWNATAADLTPTATGPNTNWAGISVELAAAATALPATLSGSIGFPDSPEFLGY